MPKTQTRRQKSTKPKCVSPLLVAAENSISPQARQHAGYHPQNFIERGRDGGLLDNIRLEKLACVRPLEGLARKHPKAKKAYLEPYHLMAANAYQADLDGAKGQVSHMVREVIDVSSDVEGAFIYRLEARQKLAAVQNRMPGPLLRTMNVVLVEKSDRPLAAIWPNRSDRDHAKSEIKKALTWLAIEYGLISG